MRDLVTNFGGLSRECNIYFRKPPKLYWRSFALNLFKFTSPNAYLLVLHFDEDAEYDITQQLRRSVKHRRLRSKTVTRSGAEMTYEVRLDNKQDLVALMLGIDGVHDATLVACQTEAGA